MNSLNILTVLDPINISSGDSLKNNFYATVNPTTSNNILEGYTNGSRWINTDTDTTFTLVDEVAGIWVEMAVMSKDTETIKVNFQYDTPSPLTLFTVYSGNVIANFELTIIEPFDDLSATLLAGTLGDPSKILPANFNKPSKEALYGTEENFPFSSTETVILTINPGVSTKGSGYILSQVKRS